MSQPHWGILGRLALAAVFGLPCAVSRAQEPGATRGENYAFLVGVNRCDPDEIRSLSFAEADVTDLAGVLKGRGYRSDHVTLMTEAAGARDRRFSPCAEQIRKELKLLLDDVEVGDRVLVALAGQGVQFRGETECYFCPAGATLSDRRTLLSLSEIYRELERCRAGMKILFLDACHSDPQSPHGEGRSRRALETLCNVHRTPLPDGVVAFLGGSEGEAVHEDADLKHGVFFHFVIEALNAACLRGEEDDETVADVEASIKRRVRDFVRSKYGVHQRPELRGKNANATLMSLSRPPAGERPQWAPSRRLEPTTTITNTVGMKLVLIPAGDVVMGSPDDDMSAKDDERPGHRVRITQPFYLGTTEVTVGQFRSVVAASGYRTEAEKDGKGGWGWDDASFKFRQDPKFTWKSPGFPQTDEHPVVQLTWHDAIAICNELSKLEGLRPYYRFGAGAQSCGEGYRLPTEAEWEYACRAGTTTRYVCGDDRASLASHAWTGDNSGRTVWDSRGVWYNLERDAQKYLREVARHECRTHPVATTQANALGLYDMHGNVWEWCWDGYDRDYYRESPSADPLGPVKFIGRVDRGGSWLNDPLSARSASRNWNEPRDRNSVLGFRIARTDSKD